MTARVTIAAAALAACSSDPQYLQPRVAIETDGEAADEDAQPPSDVFVLPVRAERPDEADDRTALASDLGVEVPHVRLDDLRVSVEWTIKNLSMAPGTATIAIDGSNEWFTYVPQAFVLDPDEDEEPPPLLGGVPIQVPASSVVTGVFREDQLREAAVDLERMTRGGDSAFAAILEVDEDRTEIEPPGDGPAVPDRAFAGLVQLEISLEADRHMVLEYVVRVRDERGLLHEGLLGAPSGELTPFMPADYQPPPPEDDAP